MEVEEAAVVVVDTGVEIEGETEELEVVVTTIHDRSTIIVADNSRADGNTTTAAVLIEEDFEKATFLASS